MNTMTITISVKELNELTAAALKAERLIVPLKTAEESCRRKREELRRLQSKYDELKASRKCSTGDCERFKIGAEPCADCEVVDAYERAKAAKDAEIARLKAALLTICTADRTAEGLREIAIDACNGKEAKE